MCSACLRTPHGHLRERLHVLVKPCLGQRRAVRLPGSVIGQLEGAEIGQRILVLAIQAADTHSDGSYTA